MSAWSFNDTEDRNISSVINLLIWILEFENLILAIKQFKCHNSMYSVYYLPIPVLGTEIKDSNTVFPQNIKSTL